MPPTADLIAAAPTPARIELAPGVYTPEDALVIRFSRGGGPGGQNVNKVNTRAELWLAIDNLTGIAPDALLRLQSLAGSRFTQAREIHLVSQVERTQESNRADVMQRLREMIVQAMVRPKPRRKTRPTAASRRRRLDAKRHRAGIKSNRRGGEE